METLLLENGDSTLHLSGISFCLGLSVRSCDGKEKMKREERNNSDWEGSGWEVCVKNDQKKINGPWLFGVCGNRDSRRGKEKGTEFRRERSLSSRSEVIRHVLGINRHNGTIALLPVWSQTGAREKSDLPR